LRVLFLCTGNSCRSQMAEGWAKALKPGVIEAYSAGTNPHGLNPLAVRAMAEAGVDISRHASRRPEEIGVPFDVVVTVCDSAHESCPVMPGARIVHVGFDDPPRLARGASSDDEAMVHYRRVRDEIRDFVRTLPQSLQDRAVQRKPVPSALKVFDPPMCCSSGVCGPEPDVALAAFAADVQWLQSRGVVVTRSSLAREPDRFLAEPAVMKAINSGGTAMLPVVMVNDRVVSQGRYPTREQLAAELGLSASTPAPTPAPRSCGCAPGKCC
jgi:arsenate reductase